MAGAGLGGGLADQLTYGVEQRQQLLVKQQANGELNFCFGGAGLPQHDLPYSSAC